MTRDHVRRASVWRRTSLPQSIKPRLSRSGNRPSRPEHQGGERWPREMDPSNSWWANEHRLSLPGSRGRVFVGIWSFYSVRSLNTVWLPESLHGKVQALPLCPVIPRMESDGIFFQSVVTSTHVHWMFTCQTLLHAPSNVSSHLTLLCGQNWLSVRLQGAGVTSLREPSSAPWVS